MDLTKDHAEYLVDIGKKLTPIEEKIYDGRRYTRQELKAVNEPTVNPIQISTLSSLIDLCTNKFGEYGFEKFDPAAHVVHVVNERKVQVVSAQSNAWKNRETLVNCELTETAPFKLGTFMNQDEFIIAVLSCFVPNDDRSYVARIAGNAIAEKVTTAQDDGVSQQIGTRSGAVLADKATVKNIVNLQLYRTFREVEQPSSAFLFRLKQSGENIPQFAFFEADGGAWKLQAVENVARYLRAGLKEAVVVS